MSETHAQMASATLRRPLQHAALGRDNLLSVVESLLSPFALIFSLWLVCWYVEGTLSAPYLILSVLVFALNFPGQARLQSTPRQLLIDIGLHWLWIFGLLMLTGYATGYIREYSWSALWTWAWAAPLTELMASMALRIVAPAVLRLQGPPQRALIVGMNAQGLDFAEKIKRSRYSRIELAGFVDSRGVERLRPESTQLVLGTLDGLAGLVQSRHIQRIYLSLPMASQPRILQILDALKDTTVSIYFVPDMFVTDLIQAHTDTVCGMTVISVCETPFTGFHGFVKRSSDILFASLILLLILPLLAAIAIAIKWNSPGPVIFRQRRYGLDGEEIVVYKFRSMTVTEDGGTIAQARKNDPRITRTGAFLRKTSLDELPQFINVLQGRMSIVGPRPHAVAHNELYRKLIKGYMVRHKVKPGITGWAQINGYRGETDTLEKMQGRVDFDLDYLRNWSLLLDVLIILKTVRLVLQDQKAY
ncbi:UDP-phosphate glucose phosphotransferase [Hylemonella gracilis str. Niagara R]|uniref:UDP-phosphate glucose phosphotransferase n=1 Tax=Hylemonella gracilis str. Niagara R TaxID=1458275 RepID=A0A016XL71_9BURK|nr:undecaprenyl-phosphate glucose phosphotransferase [Hylemonella gracilis]EYC51958.1 UDP-phosphate glucose phosphotransferase [Hylemonella gracilis str. Niagara R]